MRQCNVQLDKEVALRTRLEALGIREADFEERFIKGGGPGGQKINKTSSCVQLTHHASGIEVRCQRGRSLALNRFLARRALCERLESQRDGAASVLQQRFERIRRQKRRRSRRAQERILTNKRARAAQLALRRPSSFE